MYCTKKSPEREPSTLSTAPGILFLDEMQHTDLGKDLMNKIIEETKDIAKVESKPKFEGRQMVMIIQPL